MFPCDSLGLSLWSGVQHFKPDVSLLKALTVCRPVGRFLISQNNSRMYSFGTVYLEQCVIAGAVSWNGVELYLGKEKEYRGHFGKVWCSQIGECMKSVISLACWQVTAVFQVFPKAVLQIYGFWRKAFFVLFSFFLLLEPEYQ